MSLPTPPTGRLSLLRVTDLLLVVIVVLGGLRVLLPLLGGVSTLEPMMGETTTGSNFTLLVVSVLLQVALTLGALYAVVIRLRGLSWQDLGLVPPPPGSLMRGLLLAVISIPAIGLINLLVQSLLGSELRNPQIEALSPVAVSPVNYLIMILLAGLLVPLVEELAFRGLLQGWLRERVGAKGAIALSSLIFALMHGIPALIPALLLVGGLLAWLYETSGSLWPSVAMHAAFNSIMTTLLYVALGQGVAVG